MTAQISASTITGRTRIYAILGYPVAGVRSPELFNQWFAEHGIDAVCIPLEVNPEGLVQAWMGLRRMSNLDGVIVTMPHKNAIVPMLDHTTQRAGHLGAVNIIRRNNDDSWTGDMCDGEGFAQAIEQQGACVRDAKALLVGVGGAGSAIAWALAERGLKKLVLSDQSPERLGVLQRMLGESFPALEVLHASTSLTGIDLAINATPLGMRNGDPLPFDPRMLDAHCHVCDVVGKPVWTRLLQTAQEADLVCHAGDGVHSAQARIAQQFLGLIP